MNNTLYPDWLPEESFIPYFLRLLLDIVLTSKIQMAGWVKDLEQNSVLCIPDVLRNWFTHCKQNNCSWLKHWIQSDEECQKESTNETPRWQFHCWLRGWGNGLMHECCDMSVQEKDVKTWTLVLLNQRRSGLWSSYQNGLCTWINQGTVSVTIQWWICLRTGWQNFTVGLCMHNRQIHLVRDLLDRKSVV